VAQDQSGLIADVWAALFGSGERFNSDPRSRVLGGIAPKVEPPVADPYERSYDEIQAIQQKQSKGFRTFDINPYSITIDEFPCVIQNRVLGELFGFEDGYVTPLGPYPTDTNSAPFWRTIPIEANGTFVKIEYLPTRVNSAFDVRPLVPSVGPWIEPQNLGPAIPNPPTAYSNLNTFPQGYVSLSGQVIMQFESPDSAPLIVKHGDTFKGPFNTIYLTFKQWSPRIRITVGYNTETASLDERMLMTRPAFSGGRGLLNNPSYHHVPFSIASGDFSGAGDTSLYAYPGGLVNFTLIKNQQPGIAIYPANFTAGGMGLSWITSMDFSFHLAGGAGFYMILGLFVYDDTSPTRLRRLYQVNLYSGGTESAIRSVILPEPIRVNLRPNQSLIMRCSSPNAGDFGFSINGYSYGNLVGLTNGAGTLPLPPFYHAELVAEDPYPMDYLTYLNPGGTD